jgi:hypothetical protein
MRNTIHNVMSEDQNRHVLARRYIFQLLTFADRFPSYVQDVKTSLDELQLKIINGSPPDVGPYSHEHCSSIDMPHTVAHGHHNSNKYAGRGRNGDGKGRGS